MYKAGFTSALALTGIVLMLTACGGSTASPSVALEAAPTATPPAIPTPTATPPPSPTPTLTPTPSPTPGPGLDELLQTPVALAASADLAGASAAYAALNQLYPHRAEPLLGLAAIAQRQGDQEAALACLRAAVEADPASTEALRQLALLLEQRQQYEELVAVYAQMTELTPEDPNLRVAQATVLARLGQADSAVASLQAAQALDPYRQYAWLNVAAAASGSRQYEAAVAIATAGLEVYPHSVSLLITRGLAYFSLGQIEAALADFDSALALDNQNVTAHLWKGRALVALGRYEEAVPILQRAGELGMLSGVSGVNEGYEAMADAADAMARSDPQAAFSYLAGQVVQFGSRDPLLLGYGRVRWRQGSLSLALNYMDSLVQAGYIPALYWRAAIYADQGQNEQAIADLQAYLNVHFAGPEAEAARALLESLEAVP